MVDIKHPIEKLLTQEMIDELQDNYEKKQKERRELRFMQKEADIIAEGQFKASGHARIIITKSPRKPTPTIEQEVIEAKKGFIEKVAEVKEEVIPPVIPSIEDTIKIRDQAANDFRDVANEINGETSKIAWLVNTPEGQSLMSEYSETEGGHAIWREKITKGFQDYCDREGKIIKDVR